MADQNLFSGGQSPPGYPLPSFPPGVADREGPSSGVSDPTQKADGPGATLAVVQDFAVPRTPVLIQANPYSEYAISKVLYKKTGLAVNPVMGPPGTPGDVVRECAPWGRLIFRWVSRRRGAAPQVPSEDLQDANAVLVDSYVSFPLPGKLLDGTPAWVMEGQYTYDLRVPYTEGDVLTTGAMPFTTEAASDNALQPGNFSKSIIGPNRPPAGAPADAVTF